MATTNRKGQFHTEIFPAELEEIRRRRSSQNVDGSKLIGAPSTKLGLVGLAHSGGGIRSATFSLGVLQALGRHGILKYVDYISTVSGGGFIGSCLSSNLNYKQAQPQGEQFPLHYQPGVQEPNSISHLRNSGKYLAPGEILDKLRLPTLLLRGIIINLFVILPYIMVAVLATEFTYLYGLKSHLGSVLETSPYLMACLFLMAVITFPFVSRVFRRRFGWNQRNWYELAMSFCLLAVILASALVLIAMLVDHAIELPWRDFRVQIREQLTLPSHLAEYWKWLVMIAIPISFMLVGKASERTSQWTGKLILYTLGLVGPTILMLIYLLLCVWKIDSPLVDSELQTDLERSVISDRLLEAFADKGIVLSENATLLTVKKGRQWRVQDGIYDYTIRGDRRDLRIDWQDLWDKEDWQFVIMTLVLFLINLIFIDVNITSPHSFYRDRLSKAYLFHVSPYGLLEPDDNLRLSELNRDGTSAPYHLINATLNLQNSKDPNLRGRNADFFLFSKRYTGSDRTGYCHTDRLEANDNHMDLGTAMAISGAAAAPNMGNTTIKPLVFILTLLNVRLGYWLLNPSHVMEESWYKRIRWALGPGPDYLLKEALGLVDTQGAYVNVSDGAHLENLGIYQLIRRRCKFIIAVDGEADPKMQFGGLLTLIRYARIDMGIEIKINLNDVRIDENGFGNNHWALGEIHYGKHEIGHLLYIKSSLTGDEDDYILDYRSRHRLFPHQPTSDQFFGETQFEMYRALGYHIADRLFSDADHLATLQPPWSQDIPLEGRP